MKTLVVDAVVENLAQVQEFIENEIDNTTTKIRIQLAIAIEEIFMNIANYAYNPEVGEVSIKFELNDDESQIRIQFLDGGKPFDPLAKKDADTTLSAEARDIGGLGILMVKNSMDNVDYCYKDGYNILTLHKTL